MRQRFPERKSRRGRALGSVIGKRRWAAVTLTEGLWAAPGKKRFFRLGTFAHQFPSKRQVAASCGGAEPSDLSAVALMRAACGGFTGYDFRDQPAIPVVSAASGRVAGRGGFGLIDLSLLRRT